MHTGLIKLKQAMKDKGIESVLVTNLKNVFYLSGYTGSSAYLLITHNTDYIFTDFRYLEQVKDECEGFEIVDVKEEKKVDEILSSFENTGFEDVNITLGLFNKFRKKVRTLVPIGQMIYDIRSVKTQEEITLIKKAQEITDKGFSYITNFAKIGMTEKEVALELEFFMRRNGASGMSFDIICASGYRGALPHGEPTDKKIQEGDLVVLDFGCVYKGYMSDMTRTFGAGKISPDAKDVYDTVLDAQFNALSYISPGRVCSDVHKKAEDVINQKYPDTFGHGLGHSVGIEIHESPNFSSRCNHKLVAGNVLTVEPGIYISGKFGVRIEDMVVIGDEKYENITKSTKELIYIS